MSDELDGGKVEITLHEPSTTENTSVQEESLVMAEQRFVVERTEALRKELEEKLDSKVSELKESLMREFLEVYEKINILQLAFETLREMEEEEEEEEEEIENAPEVIIETEEPQEPKKSWDHFANRRNEE